MAANLKLRSELVPEPKPGEVLVGVAAVALNHRDVMMIADGMGGLCQPKVHIALSAGGLHLSPSVFRRALRDSRRVHTPCTITMFMIAAPSRDARALRYSSES